MSEIKFYTVAAESGSCSMDTDDLGDGHGLQNRWEERSNCGHQHRTRDTAESCQAKLTKLDKNGNCSAFWYNSRIHDQDGHRV